MSCDREDSTRPSMRTRPGAVCCPDFHAVGYLPSQYESPPENQLGRKPRFAGWDADVLSSALGPAGFIFSAARRRQGCENLLRRDALEVP